MTSEKLSTHPAVPLPSGDSMGGTCCHWESWRAPSMHSILLIEYRHDASRLVAEILDRLEVSADGPASFPRGGGRTAGAPSAA